MITVSTRDGISTLLMSRPPVNAMDNEFVKHFAQALDEIERAAPSIIVIRSDQKCFCAGADLTMISQLFAQADGPTKMVAYVRSLHRIFDRLEQFPAVTLAAIAGPALGGGLEMALACDMRIATGNAKLGLPEARVGMIPGAGGTQRLARLCGQGTASRLILSAEVVDGREAARLGIVQWCVEPGEIDAAIIETSSRVAGLSRQALLASKKCILAGLDPAQDGYAMEISVPEWLMRTEEAKQRVAKFFTTQSN